MMNAWERIQINLEKSLKPGLFQLWVKPLKGEYEPETESLKLEAPNDFIASWVREKLQDVIHETCLEVLGIKPTLKVVCSKANGISSPIKA
ncbi:MAG: DnaA N-terminal domain-containing protein, partial [Desulfonatronovibrio sp.]